MTTPQQLFETIESKFWFIIIPSMEKYPHFFSTIIRAIEYYKPLPTYMKTIIWMLLGWNFGLAFGYFATLIF